VAAAWEVKGPDDIDRLVKAIRAHGSKKQLAKELNAGLNRVTKQIRGELKENIEPVLPKRGGLAATMKRASRFTTRAKAGRWAGVTITGRARGHDIRTVAGKRLRHPVFGNRDVWVTQTAGVNPGLYLAKFDEQKPAVQRAVLDAMNTVAKKIAAMEARGIT
jgi:hypothetical protein